MTGLLLVAIDVPTDVEVEFHRWYDTEHVPERTAIEGFDAVTRWHLASGDLPAHLALFELASVDVLASGPYAALKAKGDTAWTEALRPRFLRTLRRQLGLVADYGGMPGTAAACVVAVTDLPDDVTEPYREWYDTAHGPAVAAVPGVVRARRYEAADNASPAHVTVLELEDLAVLQGDAYAEAKRRAPGDDLRARWHRSQGLYGVRPEYRHRTIVRTTAHSAGRHG